MNIVDVAVIDLTTPVKQAGFKAVALFDFTQDKDLEYITDTSSLESGSKLEEVASVFLANGGQSLFVVGKEISTASEIGDFMKEVADENDFYGVNCIIPKANQAEWIPEVKTFVSGYEKLAVLEVNGTKDEVIGIATSLNSDRVGLYANKSDEQNGCASAVSGYCFPQDEGSLTWGNNKVSDVVVSGYTSSEQLNLLNSNVNYIVKVQGIVCSQMGRTTSGSNLDITRTKDYLKNRIIESVTSKLINSKKIVYTDEGLEEISTVLKTVGATAIAKGMLSSFYVVMPKVDDISETDIANRVLTGVEFHAVLATPVETIDLELVVEL